VLAGIGAIHGLSGCFWLVPPSCHWLLFVFRLRIWSAVWLSVLASSQFGCGFFCCMPSGAGVGGPLVVAGVGGFEAVAFGGQMRGEGGGAGRADGVVPGLGVGALLVGVGFGVDGKAELAADVGWGGGAGALALKGSRLEYATVQAAEDVGFVADLQGGEDGCAHGFQFRVAAVRLGGDGLV
jgi:hypothetical protein